MSNKPCVPGTRELENALCRFYSGLNQYIGGAKQVSGLEEKVSADFAPLREKMETVIPEVLRRMDTRSLIRINQMLGNIKRRLKELGVSREPDQKVIGLRRLPVTVPGNVRLNLEFNPIGNLPVDWRLSSGATLQNAIIGGGSLHADGSNLQNVHLMNMDNVSGHFTMSEVGVSGANRVAFTLYPGSGGNVFSKLRGGKIIVAGQNRFRVPGYYAHAMGTVRNDRVFGSNVGVVLYGDLTKTEVTGISYDGTLGGPNPDFGKFRVDPSAVISRGGRAFRVISTPFVGPMELIESGGGQIEHIPPISQPSF